MHRTNVTQPLRGGRGRRPAGGRRHSDGTPQSLPAPSRAGRPDPTRSEHQTTDC